MPIYPYNSEYYWLQVPMEFDRFADIMHYYVMYRGTVRDRHASTMQELIAEVEDYIMAADNSMPDPLKPKFCGYRAVGCFLESCQHSVRMEKVEVTTSYKTEVFTYTGCSGTTWKWWVHYQGEGWMGYSCKSSNPFEIVKTKVLGIKPNDVCCWRTPDIMDIIYSGEEKRKWL